MSKLNAERRRFLRTASLVSGSVGTTAVPFALNLATLGSAVAQTAGVADYKAIVCLFFYGGNDSSHMVLRTGVSISRGRRPGLETSNSTCVSSSAKPPCSAIFFLLAL